MKKIIPFSKEISFKTRIAEITDIEVTHDLKRTPNNTIEGSFLVNGTYKMTEASQLDEKFEYDFPFTIEVDDKYDLENVKIKISDFFFEILNEDTLKINIEVELSEVELKLVQEDPPKEEVALERCYDEEEQNTLPETEKDAELVEESDEDEYDSNIEELLNMITSREEKQFEQKEQDIIDPIDILDSQLAEALEIDPAASKDLQNHNAKPITDIFTSINNDEDTFKTYYVYIVRENDTLDNIISQYQTTKEEIKEYNDLNDIKIGSKIIIPCSKNE